MAGSRPDPAATAAGRGAPSHDGDGSLKALQYFSLVSKIYTEHDANLSCSDKTLAEFITNLGRRSDHRKENGAKMPEYFVSSLLTTIHVVLPPSSTRKGEKGEG